MFALIARSSSVARAGSRSAGAAAVRSISATPFRGSSGSHMVDAEKAAEELEDGKQKNLRGEQGTVHEHAPGWNEKIASESEAIIKSHGNNKGPEELMKETVAKATEQAQASGATIVHEKTTVKPSS